MNENQPVSLTGEQKIAQILRACGVQVMTDAARVGAFLDWGYETPESLAKSIWEKTEMGFTEEKPLIRPIYAYTNDKKFQFNPVVQDLEERRLLLLEFHVIKEEVRIKVQIDNPPSASEQKLMSLDNVFSLIR